MESVLTSEDLGLIRELVCSWLAVTPRFQSVAIEVDNLANQIWMQPSPMPADDDEGAAVSLLKLMDTVEHEFRGMDAATVMQSMDFHLTEVIMTVQSPLASAAPAMVAVGVPRG